MYSNSTLELNYSLTTSETSEHFREIEGFDFEIAVPYKTGALPYDFKLA